MALNIKNQEVERLANEVATLAVETLTTAVATSLRERLDRLREPDVEALLAIGRDCAARLPDQVKHLDHGEFLYDEMGLPR